MSSRVNRRFRLGSLTDLIERAPTRVLTVVGTLLVIVGAVILVRPLASLVLLGVFVGVAAIVAGLFEIFPRHHAASWWSRVLGIASIVVGVLILVWLGRSLELLPPAIAVLLIVSGLASLGEAMEHRPISSRILRVAWAATQVTFGVLALTWPDVTLLVVAIVFGVRTILLGITLFARGMRAMRSSTVAAVPLMHPVEGRAFRFWRALGSYALSVVLVLASFGAVSVNDWLREGAPVIDAFYDPPDEVPDGHGRLIRDGDYLGRLPQNGDVRRILYTTQDAHGAAAVASAMVITPKDLGRGPHPVIVWNHGTTGVAQGCAPSLTDATATRWAIPSLENMLERGWVVVAPDYSGQGAPGDFPYLIGKGEARSALDAVLAAGELDDLVLSPDTVVWGHSQGGHAALWTTQLAGEYTPGIRVLGTAVIAPVSNPVELAVTMTSGRAGAMLTVLVSWVLVPYAETYADVEIEDYVATGARSIVREMAQRCLSEPGVMVSALTALGLSEDEPVDVGNLTGGALGRRLAENIPEGPWGTPMFVAWGTEDEVIPPSSQDRFVTKLCAAGEQVRELPVAGRQHQNVLQPGSMLLSPLEAWTRGLLIQDAPAVVERDACEA